MLPFRALHRSNLPFARSPIAIAKPTFVTLAAYRNLRRTCDSRELGQHHVLAHHAALAYHAALIDFRALFYCDVAANDGVGGELEFVLPKFYPSGKRNYKTTLSVASDSGSSPWFVTAASHNNGTGNAWPGNANAIHLYYDADQHDKVATGAGTILIFDKEDDKIMIHAVVTGIPLKQKMSDKDCWSFEIVLIEALGRQWDYTSEYEMTLSGVFWA